MKFLLTMITQSIAVLLGIPINILVLLVRFVKFYQQKRISSYHIIIVNLAIADLLSSIILGFELKNALNHFYWPFSYTACRVKKSIMALSTFIDGFFILLLSCERYYGAITIRRKWKAKTTFFITLLIWFVAFFSLLPLIVNVHMYDSKRTNSSSTTQVNITGYNNTNNLTNVDLPTYQLNNKTEYLNSIKINQNNETALKNGTAQHGKVHLVCSIRPLPKKLAEVYLYFRLFFFLLIPLAGTVFFQFKLYRFIKTHTEKMAMILRTTTQFTTNATCNNNNNNNNNHLYNKMKVMKNDSLDPAQLSHNNSRSLQGISEDEILTSPGSTATPSPLDTDTTQFIFPGDEETDDSNNGRMFNFKKHARKMSQFLCGSLRSRKQSTVEQRINKSIQLKIHILLAISIAFFVLSTPYYVWHFVHFYNFIRKINWEILLALTYCRFFHCFMNGLIYSVIDKTFRSDVTMVVKSVLTFRCVHYEDLASNNPSLRTSRTISVDLTTREGSASL